MRDTFTMVVGILRKLDNDKEVNLQTTTGTILRGKASEVLGIMKAYYKGQVIVRYKLIY